VDGNQHSNAEADFKGIGGKASLCPTLRIVAGSSDVAMIVPTPAILGRLIRHPVAVPIVDQAGRREAGAAMIMLRAPRMCAPHRTSERQQSRT
jgi:hypothetical protein